MTTPKPIAGRVPVTAPSPSLARIQQLARNILCTCYDQEAMEYDPHGQCYACRILDQVEALIDPPKGITREWVVRCDKCNLLRRERNYAAAVRLLDDHGCAGDAPRYDLKVRKR